MEILFYGLAIVVAAVVAIVCVSLAAGLIWAAHIVWRIWRSR